MDGFEIVFIGDQCFHVEADGWSEERVEPETDPRLDGLGFLAPNLSPFLDPTAWTVSHAAARSDHPAPAFVAVGPQHTHIPGHPYRVTLTFEIGTNGCFACITTEQPHLDVTTTGGLTIDTKREVLVLYDYGARVHIQAPPATTQGPPADP